MIDRKTVFDGERAAFEADYQELAHQIPHWIDIARRAFNVRVDAIEEAVRTGTQASEEQIATSARQCARLALLDAAARWQRGPIGRRSNCC